MKNETTTGKIPVVVLTDSIRNGLEAMIALAGAKVISKSDKSDKKQRVELSKAISWVRYQLARNERERLRKRVFKEPADALAEDIIIKADAPAIAPPPPVAPPPPPPNSPPVQWPKYRISDLTETERAGLKDKGA